MKRVAGSRRSEAGPSITDGAAVVIALVPNEEGLEVRIDNPGGVPTDEIAEHLDMALEHLGRSKDRSAGMF